MGFMPAGKSISRVLDKMGIDRSSEQGMFMARQMMEGMNGGRLPIKEVNELGEKALRSYKNAEAAFSTTPEKVSRYGTFENSLRAERNADAGKKVLDTHRANLSKDKARLEELKAERAGLTGSDEIYAFNERNKEEIEQLQSRIKDNPITKIEASKVRNNKSAPKREAVNEPAQEAAQNMAEEQKQSWGEVVKAHAAKPGNRFIASEKQVRSAENFGKSDEQMIGRVSNTRENFMTDIGGAKNIDEAKKIAEDYGISMKEGDFWENVDKHFAGQLESGPTIGDMFHAHHGPAFVAAGVVGASVLKMSDNRGRVPNSQLYSDPF